MLFDKWPLLMKFHQRGFLVLKQGCFTLITREQRAMDGERRVIMV